jgi:hypothetical protein
MQNIFKESFLKFKKEKVNKKEFRFLVTNIPLNRYFSCKILNYTVEHYVTTSHLYANTFTF